MSELERVDLEPVEEAEEGFICDNDQKAEWCLLQIRRAQAEKERWKEHYKAMLDSMNASCDLTIETMKRFLRDYFDTVPHKKTKTEENYPLPSGKIMMKLQATDFDYDEQEVISWLKENGGGYIKTKEILDWNGLKGTLSVVGDAVANEDGEIIPCIKAVEKGAEFKVQLKK